VSAKSALIVGSFGQDGTLLHELLSSRGYRLLGIGRGRLRGDDPSWNEPVDVLDAERVAACVKAFAPDEIYYLAARHHSSQEGRPNDAALLRESWGVNVQGLANFLEAMRVERPAARLFYAASSRIFGFPDRLVVDESARVAPADVYGVTKAAGMSLCRIYRSQHGVYAAAGILFNHESPLRGRQFLSRRIVRGAADIKREMAERLLVGDLSSEADWGSASDFVEAMPMILALPEPDDFVVATGVRRSVQNFVEEAFSALGLDWRMHVEEDPELLKRKTPSIVGDASKLTRATGWKPKTDFAALVRELVQAERGPL
jgi:GDPmannose 4,6-dehydratase